MRYGLEQKPGSTPAYNCQDCTKQKQRNCHNRNGYRQTLLLKEEWKDVPASLRHVEKWGDLKLYECPLSVITRQTWDVLRLVNQTIGPEGDVQCLPFPGAWLDQPFWYRQAVEIVRRERAEHRRKEMEKHGR